MSQDVAQVFHKFCKLFSLNASSNFANNVLRCSQPSMNPTYAILAITRKTKENIYIAIYMINGSIHLKKFEIKNKIVNSCVYFIWFLCRHINLSTKLKTKVNAEVSACVLLIFTDPKIKFEIMASYVGGTWRQFSAYNAVKFSLLNFIY